MPMTALTPEVTHGTLAVDSRNAWSFMLAPDAARTPLFGSLFRRSKPGTGRVYIVKWRLAR